MNLSSIWRCKPPAFLIISLFFLTFCGQLLIDAGHGYSSKDAATISDLAEYFGSDVFYGSNVLSPAQFTSSPRFLRNSTFIRIGALLSLTSPILLEVLTESVQRMEALRMTINKLNSDNYILRDKVVTFDILDIQRNQNGVASAIELYRKNTTTFIGPTCEALGPILAFTVPYNMCTVSFLDGVRGLANRLESEVANNVPFARTVPLDEYEIIGMLSVLREIKWTLVSAVFTNDTYGLSALEMFSQYAPHYGINTTCSGLVPAITRISDVQNSHGRMSHISNCIANSVANVAVIFADVENSVFIVQALYNNHLNHRLNLVISSYTLPLISAPQYFAHRANISLDFFEGAISITPDFGNMKAFRDYFDSRNPENNGYSIFKQFWEKTFVCLYNSTDASISMCPNDVYSRSFDRPCRCNGNETLKDVQLEPKLGYIQDAAGAIFHALDRLIYNCNQSDFPDFPGICSSEYADGMMIYRAMTNTSFSGVTGNVSIVNHDRQHGFYRVVQLDKRAQCTIVGNFTYSNELSEYPSGSLWINMSMLRFKSTSDFPTSSIYMDPTDYTTPEGIAVIILASINILLCIYSIIHFYINRKVGIIKKSSPFFCQLMLLGLILVDLGLIIWTLTPSTAVCVSKAWLTVLGVGLILANLLAKTYRIFKIFNNIRVSSKAITDIYLLKFSLTLIAMEIVLLCLYTFVNGAPSPVLEVYESDPTHGHIECMTNDETYNDAMIWTITAFNCLIVLLVALVAFLSRNAESSYNESKYIGITIYSYIVLLIICLPFYYTIKETEYVASVQFCIRSFGFLIGAYLTWIMLFGVKHKKILSMDQSSTTLRDSSRNTDTITRISMSLSQSSSSGTMNTRTSTSTTGRSSSTISADYTLRRSPLARRSNTNPRAHRSTHLNSSLSK